VLVLKRKKYTNYNLLVTKERCQLRSRRKNQKKKKKESNSNKKEETKLILRLKKKIGKNADEEERIRKEGNRI